MAAGVGFMRMRVYDVLPRNKTGQQHPRMENMEFIPFQVSTLFTQHYKSNNNLFKKIFIAT